ncbi:MAG: hypothetical protein L6R42_002115 [Xanthoria sp. 1 TBL-2021]|nr:MAG: hypothetical protein L6R42_002115 [Xanthoria sp. 1 TBL-2021]
MVSTRSQDQEPIQASKLSSAKEKNPEKRKRSDDVGSITTPNARAKKHKIEGTSRGSKKYISSTLAAVVIPTTNHHAANVPSFSSQHNGFGNYGASERKPHRAEQGRLRSSSGQRGVADGAGSSTIGVREDEKNTTSQASGSRKESAGIKQSASSKKTASSTPGKAKGLHTPELPTDTILAGGASALDTSAQPDNKPSNSRHKRFESEEATSKPFSSYPASPSRSVTDAQRTMQDAVSISSDDEAPEVVTKSSGQQEARSVAAEATKVAETQRAAEKQRRRDRDSRFKSQAKNSKVEAAKLKAKDECSDTSSEDDENDPKSSRHPHNPDQGTWTGRDALPALLPEEILAAEPTARMPTPPPKRDVVKATVNTRHRFFDQNSKPTKDLQKGNVRIRVLENRRAILPPKVSKDSQKLRESWLAGIRLGPKGKVVMERRKMGTGFVRR